MAKIKSKPLANLRVLLTRQSVSADTLAADITKMGGSSIHLPLFAVQSLLQPAYIQEIQRKFNKCKLAVCVSRNAAELILPFCAGNPDVTWATVGLKTAQCLQEFGIKNVLYPPSPPYDSAALMQVLKLNNIKLQNQYIMVFTGEQGDNWLQNALLEQNSVVDVVPVYKRVMPDITSGQLISIFNATPKIDIIVITCVTSLVNLMQLAKSAAVEVFNTPLLVVSKRIYEYAIGQGFRTVYTANSMSEQDILSALEKYR